ncbi:MAG: polysaccharide deacetylase family protein [candidate division WOR-3 bacterium]|nr:polysaccharide deacetylase family protein [candidate division WOR-3 bacterium]
MKHGLLTFDVETWFSVTDFAPYLDSETIESLPLRLEEPINLLLNILDEYNFTATFFFVGSVAGKVPGLVRQVAERGHEIGCHSSSHRLLYELSSTDLESEIIDAKHLLEDISDTEVVGFRAPTFSLTPQAIDLLANAGYRYDSSLWVGRTNLLSLIREAGLEEFPISTRRFMGKLVPLGGGYLRLVGTGFYNPLFRKGPEPLVLYLHPWEFDPDHPRLPNISLWVRFKHYNGLGRSKRMLYKLLGKASWSSCRSSL